MLSRKDPRVLPKILTRTRTQKQCVGIARSRVIELPIVAKKQRDNDSGKSKGSKKGDSKGKSNKSR